MPKNDKPTHHKTLHVGLLIAYREGLADEGDRIEESGEVTRRRK